MSTAIHEQDPSIFQLDSLCFICSQPTSGSLYCSQVCKDADAFASDQAYRRPCGCSSASSSRLDLELDLLHDCERPPLLISSGARRSSGSSAYPSSTGSSSASSPLSAPSLVDYSDIPTMTDLPPLRSPFISASNYPHSPSAKIPPGALLTPSLFTLDSPSLRPLLRYARKAFPTDVRSSGKVPNLDHRRTPSEHDMFSAGMKSAPASAAPSPILSAYTGKMSSFKDDTVKLKKKRNRQSLPGCFTALTMSSPPTVQLTLGAPHAKPHERGSTIKPPRAVVSPSLIFGGPISPTTSSSQEGGGLFSDRASITPTSRLTSHMSALARERGLQRFISPTVVSPAATSVISSLGIGSALTDALMMENALARGRSFRRRSDAAKSSEDPPPAAGLYQPDSSSESSGEDIRGRADKPGPSQPVNRRRASSPGLRDKRFLLDMSDTPSPISSRTRRRTEGRPEEFAFARRGAGQQDSPSASVVAKHAAVDTNEDERRGRSRVR